MMNVGVLSSGKVAVWYVRCFKTNTGCANLMEG